MMENNLQINNKLLWTLCIVFVLGLFSFRAGAQIATADPTERDQTPKPPTLKRLEFLALSDSAQMVFVSNPPFVILDLINAGPADLMTATPDEIFITVTKFYDQHLTPPALERDMLLYPNVFKVYQP